MVAPSAIAVALGIDHFSLWRNAGYFTRAVATTFVCLAVIVACNVWPPNIWDTYLNNPKLDLPGTTLMRIDPNVTLELQQLVQAIHQQCDTFYGVPDENSLYVFSEVPAFTGMLADRPYGLSVAQQEQVVNTLQQKTAAGERVCVVRDISQGNELVAGPLNDALDQYENIVETVDNYTIARHSWNATTEAGVGRGAPARRRGGLVGAGIPAGLYVLYVFHYSVNVPYSDDWNMIPLVVAAVHRRLGLSDLWSQYGDTRLFVPKVAFAAFAVIDHWNTKSILLFSALVFVASYALLLLLVGSYLGRPLTFSQHLRSALRGSAWPISRMRSGVFNSRGTSRRFSSSS